MILIDQNELTEAQVVELIKKNNQSIYYYDKPKNFSINGTKYLVGYQNKKIFEKPELDGILSIIGDIQITNDSSTNKKLVLPGNNIIIPLINFDNAYFHLIYDTLSEIESMKLYFPDAKIKILLEFTDVDENYSDLMIKTIKEKMQQYGITEAYGIEDSDFISLSSFSQIAIESFIFIHTQANFFAQLFAFQHRWIGKVPKFVYSVEDIAEYRSSKNIELWPEQLKKRFLKNKNIIPSKKLFISGMRSNDNKRKIAEAMYMRFLGYPLTLNERLQTDGFLFAYPTVDGSQEFTIFAERLLHKKDEKLIENFFKKSGYEIVDPMDYPSISDQAELFASATHIVALSGASVLNTCFSNQNTKVLTIRTSDTYNFQYENIVRFFGIDNKDGPRRRPWGHRTYSADYILDWIKTNASEFLD